MKKAAKILILLVGAGVLYAAWSAHSIQQKAAARTEATIDDMFQGESGRTTAPTPIPTPTS